MKINLSTTIALLLALAPLTSNAFDFSYVQEGAGLDGSFSTGSVNGKDYCEMAYEDFKKWQRKDLANRSSLGNKYASVDQPQILVGNDVISGSRAKYGKKEVASINWNFDNGETGQFSVEIPEKKNGLVTLSANGKRIFLLYKHDKRLGKTCSFISTTDPMKEYKDSPSPCGKLSDLEMENTVAISENDPMYSKRELRSYDSLYVESVAKMANHYASQRSSLRGTGQEELLPSIRKDNISECLSSSQLSSIDTIAAHNRMFPENQISESPSGGSVVFGRGTASIQH